MPLKITPLNELYPDSHFDTNNGRSYGLFHAGREYFEICNLVYSEMKRKVLLPNFSVYLPIMHQCLELIVKSFATFIDSETHPKVYGHGTLNVIKKFESDLPVFSKLLSDSDTTNLIQELEKAYFGSRYGEVHTSANVDKIHNLFVSIVWDLLHAYHDLTGVPFLPEHFATKST